MGNKNFSDSFASIADYYSTKIREHGPSPKGVDWNSDDGQTIRFTVLYNLMRSEIEKDYSICDVGCGYGAFLGFLRSKGWGGHFTGVDISENMIDLAGDIYKEDSNAVFVVSDRPVRAEIVSASGTFNVKMNATDEEWSKVAYQLRDEMVDVADIAVLFNGLNKPTGPEFFRDHLFYEDLSDVETFLKNKGLATKTNTGYGLFEYSVVGFRETDHG